jgi:hypothetical protein
MSDPLEMKPFAIIFQDFGPPRFLSPSLGSRSILIDDAPLEPKYTMDRCEAEDHVAWMKPHYPAATFEIVEVQSLDAAALSRRYDASHPQKRAEKRSDRNYGERLAARTFADYYFDTPRRKLIVERRQPSKLSKRNPQRNHIK